MKIHSGLGLLAAAAGLAAAPLLATGPARASIPDTETRSVTLRFDPRDLNTDKGADRLLSRISGAATKVCDEGGSMLQLIESSAYRVCRHEAIARAVADVNRPTVTAAYNRHFGDRERGLHAAIGPQPAVAVRMVAAD
jgi:UrcA family protein